MSRHALGRSITPNKQADSLYPRDDANYDPLPPINNARRSSKNLDHSPIRPIEHKAIEDQHQGERLKNNHAAEVNQKNTRQHLNYYYAPEPVNYPTENRSHRVLKRFENKPSFLNGWDQVVKSQAESENRAMIEQKIEERMRKQRYKENLDQIMQQQQQAPGRQGYLSNKRLGVSPLGSTPTEYETEYRNATRVQQNAQRIQKSGTNDGKRNYNAEAALIREAQQRQRIQQSPEQFQQENPQGEGPEFEVNNGSPQPLSSKRDEFEQEKDYISKIYGIPRQEAQGPDVLFYERVRYKSVQPRRPQDNSRNQSQERSIDDIIEQNRQKKWKEEEQNIERLAQERKQKYRNTREQNERLMQARHLEDQMRKEAKVRVHEILEAQIEEGKMVEIMQKQNERDYKRMYHDYLNWQVAEKQQHRGDKNQLSRVEKLMLSRAHQDGQEASEFEISPVPNGKNGYERRLQLSYIDRWLKHNPTLPPESHDRSRLFHPRDGPSFREQNKSFDYYNRAY